MTRWAAGVEYDGASAAGWQRQSHADSIQARVERALSSVAAHPVDTVAAGRTDAGVHALGQVIHFDSAAARTPHAFLLGCNTQLPPGIALRWVQAVREDFHARYRATARRYRYVIHNERARSALLAGRAAWSTYALDADLMHAAAQALVGEHDFSGYRDSQCQSRTPMRRVDRVAVARRGALVTIDIQANAFLHHMVRNISGVLIEIGQGRRPADWAAQVLAGRNRAAGGITAAACGLYFIGPAYPAEFAIPGPPEPPFS